MSNQESKLGTTILGIINSKAKSLKSALPSISPESYGAKGDGVTDDSAAIQAAVNDGYEIYLNDNKTYYLASPVTINHDVHIFGGKNTKVITKTPSGGTVNHAFVVTGTRKKVTTLTTDYTTIGQTANSGNQFTLDDMDGISIGDIMIVKATDQYYSYARPMYYLGATLLISDIYNNHLYTNISMPWNVENTENVTVEIWVAPTVIFEDIHFESDLDSVGTFKFFIDIAKCKNSVIRNCTMKQMAMGMRVSNCVNTLIDCVTVAKSKYDNVQIVGDGYGISINSCTDTIVQRVLAICAQSCVELGGDLPCINTFIRNCDLTSECRAHGIGLHENSYNIVVEDCTLGGMSLFGTAQVNRCRFIRNNRSDPEGNALSFRGSHNPDWARVKIADCVFDGNMSVTLDRPQPQSPVQAFENIIGSVEITDCIGGRLIYNNNTTAEITGNTIELLVLKNWKGCEKFVRTSGNTIKKMIVKDCEFSNRLWMNDNITAHGVYLDGVDCVDLSSTIPAIHKMHVNGETMGNCYLLPKDVNIELSSNNESAKFLVCGQNITFNSADDFIVGIVSGNAGQDIVRSKATGSYATAVSINGNGDPVYTNPNGTGQYAFYPIGFIMATEPGEISVSAVLKNTGDTDGAEWRAYIAIIDGKTGKVKIRSNGSKVKATAEGAEISHSYDVDKGDLFMCYYALATVVKESVTTFEDSKFSFVPNFAPPVEDDTFTAKRMTGDGTIKSLEGINNIMCSELTFNVKFGADYVNNPIGL